MTGQRTRLTALGIITSLHHQQSEPSSLVIPILIHITGTFYIRSLHCWFEQCLCTHAGALVLRSWTVEIVGTVPVIGVSTHTCFCVTETCFTFHHLSDCTLKAEERLTTLSLLTKKHHSG